MISPFGVEHTPIHKADPIKEQGKRVNRKVDDVVDQNGKMSDNITPIAPGTTVDVYNRSQKHKKRASAENWAAKLGGGALGAAAAYGGYRALKGKSKYLIEGSKRASADKKQGMALAGLTSVGSTVGGYAGGRAHQEYVKKNPKYRYEEK